MIESCPKKRMVLGITVLGILTVLVLIIESHWTENNKHIRKQNFVIEQNSSCWEKDKYEVVRDCEPCSEFELRSRSIGVCIHTHFKEVLKCANGETVTRSCDRAAFYDEQIFWRFEGCMFVASIISTLVFQDSATGCLIDIESLIILYIYKLIDSENVQLVIHFLSQMPVESTITVDLSNIKHKVITERPEMTLYCIWPIVVSRKCITAGLCSVARLLLKRCDKPHIKTLLGFREACLLAHLESSIWTKFCEVDMISTTKKLLRNDFFDGNKFYLPEDVARFEFHMLQPVRMHNIYKLARKTSNDKNLKSSVPICDLNLIHLYSEGILMTLADIILFPCYMVLLNKCPVSLLEDKIPLTVKWFRQMVKFNLPGLNYQLLGPVQTFNEVIQPEFIRHSLYTADPTRYEPEKRICTKQGNIDFALKVVSTLEDEINNSILPFGHEVPFYWTDIPLEANPTGGALPEKRASRKQQQLENLVKAVVKIATDKCCRIVDFCSGSGHLGILLALLLPNCEIILIENKEQSLKRARDRIDNLGLANVITIQSNLDYFHGSFDIGVSLHACGVATDLVIKNCIKHNADFIVCPCCYGGIKNCYNLEYPRSEQFQKIDFDHKNYLSLAHAADQTHDAHNVKTKQGYVCMDIIDTDRKLHAKSCGYEVHLGKLQPVTCTNKNNLLVGLYKGIS
ncbi:hypothetical protein NQ315_006625 [Exocentrus adspersus]|uniref:Protein JTB n=1 Tax=Exocentrus adspersus TaxID=1586481 RepID=A0AAV8VEG0_9CUCU|nr:hypothetical protein NQ315_006625 [Exocentrus adspersus]